MKTIYLDNSATTKPSAAVIAAMTDALENGWYNPSALYRPAMDAEKAVENAREICLKAAGAANQRMVFTSGGTEADNIAILGHLRTKHKPGRVLMLSVEHPAVLNCAQEAERMGHKVVPIPVDRRGVVDLPALEGLLGEDVHLITLMQVNNEVGAVQPIAEVAALRDRLAPNAAIHVDGVFSELADRLDSISTDLSDVVFTLSGEVDNDLGMEDLDAINGRIHELDELVRRWGPELSDVIAWRDQAVFDLEDLDASPEKVSQLQAEREKLFGEALKAARAVSKRRAAAAKELAAKVTAELESLAMSGSKLEIRVSEREHLDASGADGIDFLFTPFPGSPQMPMGKSASGGELSRLMLALELVAAEKHVVAGGSVPPMTFIFDEVDAGVGGKTAVELGARLAKLAQSAQVIVVTHLPQVASWADEQYVVAKGEMDDGSIATTINQVRGEARVHEIARMLSGSESEASLEHAEELLKSSVLD